MYRILLIVMLALASIGLAYAQETETNTSAPAGAENFSSACNPAELNWCFAGQPWGDGRCNSSNPGVTAYNYQQGFLKAAEFCGIIGNNDTSAPSVSFADDDGAFSFSCSARQVNDDEIRLSADWSRRVKNQANVVFRFDIDSDDFDEVKNFGETVGVGSFETGVVSNRVFGESFAPIELKSATAYLIDFRNTPISDPVTCSVSS